jgi:small subunit ribosomal protein S14
MAKKSKIAADRRRREVVARYAQRRAELKRVIAAPVNTTDEREAATRELRRQPRDTTASQLRNRDVVDGRPRGHPCAFDVSRVRLRELAHGGYLPGVRKSSR